MMHQWEGRWSGAGPVLICFRPPPKFWVGHVNLRLSNSHEPHDDFLQEKTGEHIPTCIVR